MIRNRADLWERARTAVELATSLIIVWFGVQLGNWLGDGNLIAEAVIEMLGFGVAIVLPALLYGRPRLAIQWTVDSLKTGDETGLADFRASAEVAFGVELYASTSSIYSIIALAQAKRRGLSVVVKIDAGVLDVKYQNASLGVTWTEDPAIIRLPITTGEHAKQQSRFIGSLLPNAVMPGDDSTTISYDVVDPSGSSRRYVAFRPAMSTLLIRS